MPYILQIAFAGCIVATIVQCILLRRLVRHAIWLRSIVDVTSAPSADRPLSGLSVGSPVPTFRADVIGTERRFSSSDLRGGRSLLLFLSANTALVDDEEFSSLRLFTQVLSQRLDGRIYIVCSGPTPQCEMVRNRLISSDTETLDSNRDFLVLADPYGFIARACFVQRTPAAVRIDERGRVEQYGFPLDVVLNAVPASVAEELGLLASSLQLS